MAVPDSSKGTKKVNKIIIKTAVFTFFFLLILNNLIFAGAPIQIELNDGSVIKGEIISFRDGLYTIKTDILGTVKIKESHIHIIRSMTGLEGSSDALKQQNLYRGTELEGLMNKMMSDEQIMTMIYSLQNDPDIKNILKDPDLLNALNAGDIDTLMSNPTFMNLLQNKKIQQIKKRMNQ
jgi:hypothetical protein